MRHLGAIRRPGRPFIVRAGRMREVACGPFLYGRGEDVPARGKQHPLAFGTEFDLLDEVGGGDIAGPAVDAIVGHAHGDVYALARFHIEDLQLAVEFVDDALLAVARGPSHIPQRVVGDLPGFAAGGVVRVDVEVAVAIRVVVDLLADPHGVAAGARTFGDALGGVRFGVEDVDRRAVAIRVVVDLLADPHGVAAGARTFGDALGGVRFGVEDVKLVGLAAAVALLGAEVARLRRIHDLVS